MVFRSAFLAVAVALLALLAPVQAIKFDLLANQAKPFCIWHFAVQDTLMVVTANAPPTEGMRIDMSIVDGSVNGRDGPHDQVYQMKRDVNGEVRMAITTQHTGDVGVCLNNVLTGGSTNGKNSREVDLDIDLGAEAMDYAAIANKESLSLLEVEMRKIESMTRDLVDNMGYMQRREMRMRDTNESTNDRVKWFSIAITVGTVGLGVWQLIHLRSFFKRKYLID